MRYVLATLLPVVILVTSTDAFAQKRRDDSKPDRVEPSKRANPPARSEPRPTPSATRSSPRAVDARSSLTARDTHVPRTTRSSWNDRFNSSRDSYRPRLTPDQWRRARRGQAVNPNAPITRSWIREISEEITPAKPRVRLPGENGAVQPPDGIPTLPPRPPKEEDKDSDTNQPQPPRIIIDYWPYSLYDVYSCYSPYSRHSWRYSRSYYNSLCGGYSSYYGSGFLYDDYDRRSSDSCALVIVDTHENVQYEIMVRLPTLGENSVPGLGRELAERMRNGESFELRDYEGERLLVDPAAVRNVQVRYCYER